MHALHESTTHRRCCSLAAVGGKVTPDNKTHVGGLVEKGEETRPLGIRTGWGLGFAFYKEMQPMRRGKMLVRGSRGSILSEPEGWPV